MDKTIHLLDLIENKKLDDFLEAFSKATGVSSIIADIKGQPITQPHNFSVLCKKYCRCTEIGKRKCWESDRYGGLKSANSKKRFIYKCLNAGIWDSASPIIIDGYHLATALCGQVLTEPIAEDVAIERAVSIGVDDTRGYLNALDKIPLMSFEHFENIVNLMGVVTNTISELALQKYLSSKRSQNYLNKMIDSVSDGIIAIDNNGTISTVNNACLTMFGHKKNKIVGTSIFSLLSGADSVETLQNQIERSLEANTRTELPAVTDNNKTFPVQISISKLKAENQEEESYVAILRDISEEKKIEQIKADLVGMLTHDMGNPVLSIQKAIQLMVDETLGELSQHQMEIMNLALGTSHQLLGMVTDFLDIYRKENGKFLLRKLSMDLNQMIHEGINHFKIFALEKQISIHSQLSSGALLIKGDRNRLLRTFINLLDNSIKFSPKGSEIEIKSDILNELNRERIETIVKQFYTNRLQLDQDYVLIDVTDHGPGIPKKKQQHLFEKFFSIRRRKKTGRKGLGLGLAFCKQVVDAHDGFICTESPLHKNDGISAGCRFSFILPMISAGKPATDVGVGVGESQKQ